MKKIINLIFDFFSKDNSDAHLSPFSITLLVFHSLLIFSIVTFDNWRHLHLLTYAFLLIVALLLAIRFFVKKRIPAPDYKIFYFIVFFAYAFVVTVLKSRAYGTLVTSFGSIVLIFTSYYVFTTVCNLRKTLVSIIIPIIVFSIIFCVIYRTQILSLDFTNRIGSFFSNENTISITFNLGFFVSLVFIFFGTKKSLVLLPAPLLFVFCSLFTGSRKGILMFVIILVVIIFIRFWNKKIIIITSLICLVALIVIGFTIPSLSPIRDRILGTLNIFSGDTDKVDGSSALRYRMLMESLYGGLENFWIGRGIDGFRTDTIYGTYSHNNLGEMFYNFGVIGTSIYYLPFLMSCFNSKKDLASKSFVCGFVAIICLFSFSSVFYYDKLMSVFVGLLIYSTDVNGLFDKRIVKSKYYSFEV